MRIGGSRVPLRRPGRRGYAAEAAVKAVEVIPSATSQDAPPSGLEDTAAYQCMRTTPGWDTAVEAGKQPSCVNCIDPDGSEPRSQFPRRTKFQKRPEELSQAKVKRESKPQLAFPNSQSLPPPPPVRLGRPLQATVLNTSSAPVADGGARRRRFPRAPRWRGTSSVRPSAPPG